MPASRFARGLAAPGGVYRQPPVVDGRRCCPPRRRAAAILERYSPRAQDRRGRHGQHGLGVAAVEVIEAALRPGDKIPAASSATG